MAEAPPPIAPAAFDANTILAIERPHPRLMSYYFLCCLATGPLFPIVILPNYFRYHTMRYRFDAEGISMRWGILFRREVILNYARIQDIHLVSNFVERWFGLARIRIQTASGSATAEMTLEGLMEFEAVRDFLYSRMRGVKEGHTAAAGTHAAGASAAPGLDTRTAEELTGALRAVSEELRAVRLALAERKEQ